MTMSLTPLWSLQLFTLQVLAGALGHHELKQWRGWYRRWGDFDWFPSTCIVKGKVPFPLWAV